MTTSTSPATPRDLPVAVSRYLLPFLSIAQFMVFLDISIVNVALPSIQESLSIGDGDLQYVVTAYGTVLGGFLLLGGRLADRWGRRRMLQSGLALFTASSFVAGMANDTAILIAARGVQGLGASLITPAALSILMGAYAPGPARNKALGVWGSLTGIASVCGVLLGGVITDGPGWRWIFWINVPIGVAAVALALVVLPESRGIVRKFDALGAVLLTAGLLLLIHTFDESVDAGWTSSSSLTGFGIASALLLAFVIREALTSSPLLPLGIFRLTRLRQANLATFAMMGSVTTLFFFTSLFMQHVLGYSPMRTGLSYAPLAMTVAAAAVVSSLLVERMRPRAVLAIGLLTTAAALWMLSRQTVDASYAGDLLPTFLVAGAGLGLAFVPLTTLALNGVDEEESGLAAGLLSTSQEAGGAVGLALASTIALSQIDELLGTGTRTTDALVSGFHHAFLAGAACALVALVFSGLRGRASSH